MGIHFYCLCGKDGYLYNALMNTTKEYEHEKKGRLNSIVWELLAQTELGSRGTNWLDVCRVVSYYPFTLITSS